MATATTYPVAQTGDIVRLYGLIGTYRVEPTTTGYDFRAVVVGEEHIAFGACQTSVVELNGQPMPLRSAPIGNPDPAYPHLPTFDYDDGPESLGTSALIAWLKANPTRCSACGKDAGNEDAASACCTWQGSDCEGHPEAPDGTTGTTFYCDGSCRQECMCDAPCICGTDHDSPSLNSCRWCRR